ncbi:hypothetical protein OKW50_004833 [Paraburkholderia youngii]
MTEPSETTASGDEPMREILETLLADDEDITARAVARLHPTIKVASSISGQGEDERQGNRSLRSGRPYSPGCPGKGRDGRYRAEEFVGTRHPMKPRCGNWKKRPRLSQMT